MTAMRGMDKPWKNKLPLPLDGIPGIELATNLAVPLSTRLLADWGAEIIKWRAGGDPYRTRGLQLPLSDDTWKIRSSDPHRKKIFVCLD
jgi:crotonobetainyl-CoA:carnitine CoA-transferase CaiB-like acyl-CoA transferase